MAFEKWNTSGKLTWSDGEILYSADLNGSIDETTPPIGSIIAWNKTFTSVPQTLPAGWVECDGSVISDADSPLNGETLPNLQTGDNLMLRGAATSTGTGGLDTHTLTETEIPAHTHDIRWDSVPGAGTTYLGDIDDSGQYDGTVTSQSTGGGGAHNNIPAYYNVVWIMRIK